MNPATAQAFEMMMRDKQVRRPNSICPLRAELTPSRPQMKDFMALYQGLVARCFNDCCNDFTSKALSSKEVRCTYRLDPVDSRTDPRSCRLWQETCVQTCSDKFLKMSERVGLRFSEQVRRLALLLRFSARPR